MFVCYLYVVVCLPIFSISLRLIVFVILIYEYFTKMTRNFIWFNIFKMYLSFKY